MAEEFVTLRYWNGQVLCPRCDYQGAICRVRITRLGITAFLCDECDALWLSDQEIGSMTFVDYGSFMLKHGLPGLWDELGTVENVWKRGI